MGQNSLHDTVYHFLQNFKMATVATVDKNGKPHAATVYCVADADLNLYFTTRTQGRKYENLSAHPAVAMVVTDEKDLITVQLSGKATVLMSGEKIEDEILAKLWRLRFAEDQWPVPPIKLFESGLASELAVVKVEPTEMTYANFENTPKGYRMSFFHKVI